MSHIKGKLVLSVFDLPAKASILAMKEFNDAYGCLVFCTMENNSRVYLPEVHVECIHDSIVQSGEQVLTDGISVDGVLGVSPLAYTLDLVACIPIDYMQCCLEGIAKMLLQFWIDSSNHLQSYHIGQQVVEVDNELMKQHPASGFSRPPRSIQKHLKYWKASQLQYWTLFYHCHFYLGNCHLCIGITIA